MADRQVQEEGMSNVPEDDQVVRGRGRGVGRASRMKARQLAAGAGGGGDPGAESPVVGSSASTSSAYGSSTRHDVGSSGVLQDVGSLSIGHGQSTSSTASLYGGESDISESGSGASGRTSRSGSTVTRPENWVKKGKDGRIMEVHTNYFEVSKECLLQLYQFRVDFIPEEDNTQLKKDLVRSLADRLGRYIFDGQIMYRSENISDEDKALETMGSNGKLYKVLIRLVGLINPTDPQYIQFYNVILRKCMSHLKLEELGRNFYDRFKKISIPEGKVELWPGYATAIKHHENGLFLCAEITHKVLRTATVANEINDLKAKLRSFPLEDQKSKIKEELVGQIVMSSYNRKTYRIDDIDFDATPDSHLGGVEGDGTYTEYFLKKYNQVIQDKNQPMLVSNPRKRDINKGITNQIYLVPSLCNMTGLSNEMRKNFQLMKRISENLHVNPTERKKKLDDFMHQLKSNTEVQKEFQGWNVDFSPTFVKVDARCLTLEKIILDGGEEVLPDGLGDWTNALRGKKLALCKNLDRWILFAPDSEQPNLDRFIDGICRQGKALGLRVAPPQKKEFYDPRRPTNKNIISSVMEKFPNLQMVFFVLPNNQLRRYAEVKQLFLLTFKVPLQCFLSKNMQHRSFNSICSKLMIQVNAKLGGEPWQIKIPLQKLMVLGFDVYHCAQRKGESVGALVATISPNLCQYYSTVSFHAKKEELSNNMCLDTKKCLMAYQKVNGDLPNRIVLYRDGVGDGQVQFVLDHEIAHIKAALKEVYGEDNDDYMFSFIIVTKKINTRAMVLDETSRTYSNPVPGTVIDDIITLPERYDFFLVSQSVRQGTVSPTSYNVVYDTSGMSPDRMQRLTYKMCHMYFNWSGTVAVPAPCQYAHKLAYLTAVALDGEAPVELSDVLWYL